MADKNQGNGKDVALERIEFRRKLASLSSKGKLDALIDHENAAAMVRAVPPEDLYYAIADVGLADATEIVQLASPAQFRAFIDLGGWQKDTLQPVQVLAWLSAAHSDSMEDFLAKLGAMDLEVVELLLRRYVTVHSLEENPDVNPKDPVVETPEGKYLLEVHAEGAELVMVRTVLNALIAQNPFEATRLFEAVRWEVPTEMEETAYRFRQARLSDMGFPALEDAVKLFARVPLPPAPRPRTEALEAPRRVDFLQAGLRGLTPEERDNLEDELRYLVNSALVAEAADPGELDAIRTVSERARDYLSLGLEHLSGGDPSRAADAFRAEPSQRLFQIGFSLTLELKFRADRVMKAPLSSAGGLPLAFDFEARTIEALRRKRPMRALKVPGAEPVAFRSRRELAEADAVLTRAEGQIAVLRALLGGTEEKAQATLLGWPGAPTGERLFAGALASALLEGRLAIRPVPAERLGDLLGRLFEGDPTRAKLKPDAKAAVLAALPGALEEPLRATATQMTDALLERFLSELGPAHLGGSFPAQVAAEILPIS